MSITVEDRGDRIAVVFHSNQREIVFTKDSNPSTIKSTIINEVLPELEMVMISIIGMITQEQTDA